MSKITTKNNKLIAEFMGVEKEPETRRGKIVFLMPLPNHGVDCYDEDCLQYHSDWNWLMPVVQKISHVEDVFRIIIGNVSTVCKMDQVPDITPRSTADHDPLKAVYKYVVAYIKRYNYIQAHKLTEKFLIKKGFKSKHGWITGSCHYVKNNIEVRCTDNGCFWHVTTGNQIYEIIKELKTETEVLKLLKTKTNYTLDWKRKHFKK